MITVTHLANAILAADNRIDHIDSEYVEGETDLVFHGTLNLASIISRLSEPAAPVVAPLTLDDLARVTDALCDEYRKRMTDHIAWYTARVDEVAAACDTSPELDHAAAGNLFLTKINMLVKEFQ